MADSPNDEPDALIDVLRTCYRILIDEAYQKIKYRYGASAPGRNQIRINVQFGLRDTNKNAMPSKYAGFAVDLWKAIEQLPVFHVALAISKLIRETQGPLNRWMEIVPHQTTPDEDMAQRIVTANKLPLGPIVH